MDAVGRQAGGIAHDFNNLLTVILGHADLLLDPLRPEDPLRRRLDLIKTTAGRAADLTRQLLAFSRKQVLQPAVLDLNAVTAGTQEMLGRLIGEHIALVRRSTRQGSTCSTAMGSIIRIGVVGVVVRVPGDEDTHADEGVKPVVMGAPMTAVE
jgi:signal transduction histidine kinase